MKSKKRTLMGAVASAMALCAPMVAHADSTPVQATLFPLGASSPNPSGLEPGTDSLSVTFGSDYYSSAFIGQINWYNTTYSTAGAGNLNGNLGSVVATIPGGASNTFYTYCIEGTQNVYFGTTETWSEGVVSLTDAPVPGTKMTATQATEITQFWNLFSPQINSATNPPTSILALNDYDGLATAFQLGIWEIVNDGLSGYSAGGSTYFTTGALKSAAPAGNTEDQNILNQATAWLDTLETTPVSKIPNDYTVYALADGGIQDQIFAVPSVGQGSPVPLPPALPAGLSALSLLAVASFWRLRRQKAAF